MIALLRRLLSLWPPFGGDNAGRVGGPYTMAAGAAFCSGAAAGMAFSSGVCCSQAYVSGVAKGKVMA
jgi:hypothetical protein